jgi:putative endonuclease
LPFWVYIVASSRNGTIYVGHTDDLYVRTLQHRDGTFEGFTKRYGCKVLVWAEEHDTRDSAFKRERAIKEWRRAWKLRLIEEANPTWRDLFDEMFQVGVDADQWTPPEA